MRSRVDRVGLCAHEPQTAPQFPRMGGNISEKTGCRIEPRMDADTSNLIPRSLALEGMSDDVTGSDIAARPEVNKKHTVFRSKSCFLFN